MKYVTRPAPPPPGQSSSSSSSSSASGTQMTVKQKPPRPPPPVMKEKRNFSNLFGIKSNPQKSLNNNVEVVPKLPPICFPNAKQVNRKSDVQLINFNESPPSSPVNFIKKQNTDGSEKDSVSIDSFCSTNSSPHNFNSGTQSQTESGFEDDFNSISDYRSSTLSRSTTYSSNPFDCLDDDFTSSIQQQQPSAEMPSVKSSINIRNLKPQIQPKPSSSTSPFSFGNDTLKTSVNVKPHVVSMPTIIKPTTSTTANRKPHLAYMINEKPSSDESFEDDPPSPPMPNCPAPVLVIDDDEDQEKESWCLTLYDFESDVTEDLNFKANEKIYLLKQMNDEWFYGRNRKGCEGIFPINFVEVRVPLKSNEMYSENTS